MQIGIGDDPRLFLEMFETMNQATSSWGNISNVETFDAKERLVESILEQVKELIKNDEA